MKGKNNANDLPINATANAILYPAHWKVPIETYLDIIDLLLENCPEWKEYYQREVSGCLDFIKARRIGRQIQRL